MYIKVTVLEHGHGLGPSEYLIGVKTSDGGTEQVIVSKRILQGDTIDVGLALTERESDILIELPRESTSGRWRIWIPASEIVEHMEAAE